MVYKVNVSFNYETHRGWNVFETTIFWPYLPVFFIEPELPHGLMLDENTGAIDGTPSVRILPTKFSIAAFEGKRKYRVVVTIEVQALQGEPPSLSEG